LTSSPRRATSSRLNWLAVVLVIFYATFSTDAALAESASASEEEAASGRFESTERPSVATLPPPGDHWVWVPDRLLGHSLLYDGDTGIVLGMIDSPLSLTPQPPILSTERREIYSVDVGYARGNRGARTDFLTIYDLETLAYKDEIVFPTDAATGNTSIAYSAAIGSRFIGVFNQFPATSVSILDLDNRSFVEEIGVAGCSGIYPIDELRFATLCGDGTATVVELTPEGRKANLLRSEKFFDTLEDPVFTSAGRIGSRWIFVSFGGMVHTLDFSGATPKAEPPWSLHGEDAGPSTWRPGGLQLVAVHAASERLFVVMHEGGPGSHKLVLRSEREKAHRPNRTAVAFSHFSRRHARDSDGQLQLHTSRVDSTCRSSPLDRDQPRCGAGSLHAQCRTRRGGCRRS